MGEMAPRGPQPDTWAGKKGRGLLCRCSIGEPQLSLANFDRQSTNNWRHPALPEAPSSPPAPFANCGCCGCDSNPALLPLLLSVAVAGEQGEFRGAKAGRGSNCSTTRRRPLCAATAHPLTTHWFSFSCSLSPAQSVTATESCVSPPSPLDTLHQLSAVHCPSAVAGLG